MKLNKLLVVGGLIALYTHTHTHTQLLAQQPKWTIHNSIVDYQNLQTSPLPTVPNPDYTQNAIWDANGDLKVYQADGIIYDANGGVILDMEHDARILYGIASTATFTLAGFTEFIFVPIPGECGKYYGITTFTNGDWSGTYITDVIWCEIDISTGLGSVVVLPQSGLRVAKEGIGCMQRGTEDTEEFVFQMHIEVTKLRSNGNRYLFASNQRCVSVLSVTSWGITFIDGYNTGGKFAPNLRSEMEVYQTGNTYEIAMSYYNEYILNGLSYATIFKFDMSGTPLPIISHYHVSIPGDPNQDRIIKGLEYSADGLILYASIMTVNITYTSITSGNNIIYFERQALGTPFTYGGVITAGGFTQDFGLGMIEKGSGGKLWFAGNGRLGTLANSNNPTGGFSSNTMDNSNQFFNQLTNSSAYNNGSQGSSPSQKDIFNRKLYLLVDQIDGEDYSSWTTGSDLFPSLIEVCSFPYTFPYMIPANATTWYTGQLAPNGDLLTGGTMGIFYQLPNGCEYTETITILPKEEQWCNAGFYWKGGTESVDPDLEVVSKCNNTDPSIIHSWELFKLDAQGNWVSLGTGSGHTHTFMGVIFAQNTYKVVHHVYNTLSTCFPQFVSSQILTV